MTLNKQQKIAQFEEEFDSVEELKHCLRVHFDNGEIYDLKGFFLGQDTDEDWPHCYTTVVRVIRVEKKRRGTFKPGSAMMFHLDEVESVG